MIPFNVFGHSNILAVNNDPLVWVDYSDSSSWVGTGTPELVTNGTFDTDVNGWSGGVSWVSGDGGRARLSVASQAGVKSAIQSISLTIGVDYVLSYEIYTNSSVSNLRATLGNGLEDVPFTVGVHTIEFNYQSGSFFELEATLNPFGNLVFDNVSVKEKTQDLTTLLNKGSLGGAMTLNGSVKVANGGFESWGSGDYITRDLGEPFLTNNSFTIATTFNFQNDYQSTQYFSEFRADLTNRGSVIKTGSDIQTSIRLSNTVNFRNNAYYTGVQTVIQSFDLSTGDRALIMPNGEIRTLLGAVGANNTANLNIALLNGITSTVASAGANNPLHEFRLYNRAYTLEEMQTLQIELNNKYA